MSSALPFQFFQTPEAIGIVFEHIDFRIIYMNGKHPADAEDYPDWEGHSIGRWDGDVLVVDTVAGHLSAILACGAGSVRRPRVPGGQPCRRSEFFVDITGFLG